MGSGKGGGSVSAPSPSEYMPLVQEQARLNRVDTHTPWGSTTFNETPGTTVTETYPEDAPFGGKFGGRTREREVPGQIESRTTLSPELQRLFNRQVGMAGDAVGDPRVRERQLAMALDPQSFNQDIEQAVFDRSMNLLQPGMEQDTRRFEQRMADQGLPMGGEAYDDAFDNLSRSQNQLRENAALSAVTAGNQAALQERGQNLGELQSLFGQDMAGRGQQFNELAAILGRSQVAPTQPVDVMGPANMAMNANMANMQNQQAGKSSLVNAGTGLGAAYLLASDRRLKENIAKVGELSHDLGVYRYNFIGDDAERIGVMADEVEKVMPEAVVTRDDGMKMVNYGMVLNAYAG